MKPARIGLLPILLVVVICAACNTNTGDGEQIRRATLPTLLEEPVTCRSAFEDVRDGSRADREQGEFDSLVACVTTERWLEVGSEILATDRKELEESLDELCVREPRHTETPVCRGLDE